ncbi:hypothetical protein DFH07DRAFT_32385 [Mycena maculata]|uniref:NADAR domain-containing protein n=1 Tax=Mycena maculata TaxID=230809 RepID=A0AAD7NVJ7_9AGAR|nr:hypothetical protein DFH07DRAFT_32385 [Mycena maculata]
MPRTSFVPREFPLRATAPAFVPRRSTLRADAPSFVPRSSFHIQPRQRIYFCPRKEDQYYGFTNWAPHRVKYNDKEYPTSEHLFQAFKYIDNRPDIAEMIRTVSKSSREAFKCSMAHKANQHPDWERMKVSKMEIALWHKFSQNKDLKLKLLGTGDAELINYTDEEFWGVGKGRNELGNVLERVRSSLRGS